MTKKRQHGFDPDFFRGRRVFLTGHTGFKGAWLTLWLHQLGAQVIRIEGEAGNAHVGAVDSEVNRDEPAAVPA